MKLTCSILLLCHLSVAFAFAELENGDFSEGKAKWRGDGKVEKIGDDTVLAVTLSKNNFSETTQDLKMPATVKRIKVTVQVQPGKDYVFNEKSRNISDVDWTPGGNYSWSALVHPKSDFHIRVKDDSFRYKLAKAEYGVWTTVEAEIRGIKNPKDLELALVFPPGDGVMMVKSVKVEELKE
ncbi:hypothetical protein FEM03_03800 [Phragmitibacter flavus]|uniref:CBM-cenC domain-containing protein n=1 Tax=Phragmitibacter flavus TaxID=2576071 RepID=A0A5R8KHZ8_9BACT|nr:hypothetical protein [Phragmitibacter flavus]TLD71860.1 hypothetical protein FEM03_03800 [Phragmitibacter flavus]